MDFKYKNNIRGSPYISEKFGQQLKAKAASALGAYRAMTGSSLKSPEMSKIEVHWNIFIKQLFKLLKDIKDNIIPLIYYRSHYLISLNSSTTTTLNKLIILYNYINPYSIKNQQLKNLLKEKSNIDESFLDILKRDIKLNKALASRDTDKIITAYLFKIKKYFDNFISEVSKSLKIPKNEVLDFVINRIPPTNRTEYIINRLLDVFYEFPETKKFIDPNTGKYIIFSKEKPVNKQQQPITPNSPENIPSVSTTIPSDNTVPTTNEEIEKIFFKPNNFASIIDRTIDIIIRTVSIDPRSANYIGKSQKELPKTWSEPLIAKGGKTTTSKKDFLYHFQSLYRKHPGHGGFSIEVDPKDESLNRIIFPNIGEVNINVIWHNDSKINYIYVNLLVVKNESSKFKILLFVIPDHFVIPQSDFNFDIYSILNEVNNDYSRILDMADTSLIDDIKNKSSTIDSNLARALYAVVDRKRMEFKAIEGGLLNLSMNADGSVTDYSKTPPLIISQDELGSKLYADPETSEKWIKSLEQIGYFEEFPQMKPILPEDRDVVKEAMLYFKTLGFNQIISKQKAIDGWYGALKMKKDPKDVTIEDVVSFGLSGKANISSPEVTPERPLPTITPISKISKKEVPIGNVKEENGLIIWENPKTGEEQTITPKKVIYLMTVSKNFVESLKNAGLYDKYSKLAHERGKNPIKESKYIFGNKNFINPFQIYNII